MMRLNLLLVLAVMASALYLVNLQYQSRQLFSELDRARAQTHKLEVENERLRVEKRAQATSARIEKLAKTRLQMRAANPAITTYVSYAASAASAAASAPNPSVSGALR